MRFISLDQIQSGMVLSKNIYDASLKLLLRSGSTLNPRYIRRIQELGYQGVYITDDISSDIQIDDIVDTDLRIKAFETVKAVCIHAYHYSKQPHKYASGVEAHHEAIRHLTHELITDIRKRNIERINLIDLKIFEDYIISHNVNVGILALYLGIALDLNDMALEQLGIAALLHDVGKMFLDPKVLNKVTKLTPQEYKAITQHCQYSYQYIKESYSVHPNTYISILYHHERMDGQGYPKGKSGSDIPILSQIIAICDVYDALTSNRPNRPPLLPSEAMEYMMGNGNSAFGIDFLKTFTRKVAPFPKGIEVRLSNNEQGLVVENFRDMSLRPLIRVFKDQNGNPIPVREINLKEDTFYLNVTVKDVLHTKQHV